MNALGTVRLRDGTAVTLNTSFVWESPDSEAARLFNLRFDPFALEEGMSSAGIPFGRRAVAEAARVFGGVATFPPLPPLPAGVRS